MAKRKIKRLNRKKLSMLSIFLSRRRVYNDYNEANDWTDEHILRVVADGGSGYDRGIIFSLFESLIDGTSVVDCAYFAHLERVITDGGNGVDEQNVRNILNIICEL